MAHPLRPELNDDVPEAAAVAAAAAAAAAAAVIAGARRLSARGPPPVRVVRLACEVQEHLVCAGVERACAPVEQAYEVKAQRRLLQVRAAVPILHLHPLHHVMEGVPTSVELAVVRQARAHVLDPMYALVCARA